jgi:hypothetical protein
VLEVVEGTGTGTGTCTGKGTAVTVHTIRDIWGVGV